LRDYYDEVTAAGAEVVAVGTGDARYAAAFVAEERVPFPVLVDDEGAAATAAAVHKVNFLTLLFDPRSMKGGRRVNQLGATFVLGPGSVVRYAHVDAHTADHAPLADVLAVLPG
jgi:peroxiredoxin